MTDNDRDSLLFVRKMTKPQNYPVENISICRYGDQNFRIGIASMQGFRHDMEDAHVAMTKLTRHPDVGFFGVFDGHKGSGAARWFSENVCKGIDNLPVFTEDAFKQTLIDLDQQYLKSTGDLSSGTTATFCTVERSSQFPEKPYKVTVANVGDSRFYVGRKGTPKFTCLTRDHKPSDPGEKKTYTCRRRTRVLRSCGFAIRSVTCVRGSSL